MLKNIPIFAGMLLASLAPAFAGGYVAPVIAAPVVPQEPPAAPRNWQGPYLGGAIGYALGADDRVGIAKPGGGATYSPGSVDIQGVTYSVHLGYRWQRALRDRQIVTGPELAYEGGSADDSFDKGGVVASSELDRLLSLRWKTGILNDAKDTLFYGSVGFARGKFGYSTEGAGMAYKGDFKDNAWTVGLGLEKKLNDRFSLFGEREFRQFGKTSLTDATGYSTRATPEHHHVRLGMNVSF